jgi:hypothetical protein
MYYFKTTKGGASSDKYFKVTATWITAVELHQDGSVTMQRLPSSLRQYYELQRREQNKQDISAADYEAARENAINQMS